MIDLSLIEKLTRVKNSLKIISGRCWPECEKHVEKSIAILDTIMGEACSDTDQSRGLKADLTSPAKKPCNCGATDWRYCTFTEPPKSCFYRWAAQNAGEVKTCEISLKLDDAGLVSACNALIAVLKNNGLERVGYGCVTYDVVEAYVKATREPVSVEDVAKKVTTGTIAVLGLPFRMDAVKTVLDAAGVKYVD